MTALNKNNSAVKRIMQEARELANDPSTDYTAAPLEDDIFEWHCTMRGSPGTEFEGGLYHFRILLPAEYPFRPPSIMMLTPNGRFELNTKICISFTSYHEELWQPAWGVRTAIIGLQGFFPLKGQAAVGVGSIEYPASERKRLAILSNEWECPHCKQTNRELLPDAPVTKSEEGQIVRETVTEPIAITETTPKPTDAPSESADETTNVSDITAIIQPNSGSLARINSLPAMSTNQSAPIVHLSSTSPRSSDSFADRSQPMTSTAARPTASETPPTSQTQVARRSSHKPPLLLDTAICILLVLLFAIICRRMV